MLYVQDVSPRNVTKYTNGTKTTLLALFSPMLPKWANFSVVLSEVALHFSKGDSELQVLKGNCRVSPVGGLHVHSTLGGPPSRVPLLPCV